LSLARNTSNGRPELAAPAMTDPAESLLVQVLVLRCQTGDASAFAELIGRYDRRVRYYLQKMLGERPDRVDDLCQELWLDVFRSIRRLREPRAFGTWLYRLARDRAWRDLRRTRPEATSETDAEEIADDAADESFSAADAEEVHRALGELTPEHREVLLLRFVEDMSYEQIAAVVGCGVGTVRSRIHYGKRALRAAMSNTGDQRCALQTNSVRR
jgi:RNA polymerase sigma-70 factor (ECF subfamily)